MAGDDREDEKLKKKDGRNFTTGGRRGCGVVTGSKEHGRGGAGVEAAEQQREEAARERGNLFAENCFGLLRFEEVGALLPKFEKCT